VLCSCEFCIFCFTILKFRSLQFFFVILWVFRKTLCEVSQGRKVFAFLLVNFKSFLFSYFKVPEFFKFSICHFGGF
jgi:hypothetical protein